MNDLYRIDKARVRASFDRAASGYDAAAVLQAEVRQKMRGRLDYVKIEPQIILDAGCGTGRASDALAKRFHQSRVISLDLAFGMLEKARRNQTGIGCRLKSLLGVSSSTLVCADIERLPLADNTLGMIWSNLAIQWCNDLDLAFSEAHRVLQPEGLYMFSTFGPDTLKELRAASDNGHTHVSRFIDMHDIGDTLVRVGFSAPVLDVEHYTLTYDDVKGVMRDLKAIGAHNATEGRARGLRGRAFLEKLARNYEQFRRRDDGKLPATYEVIYGHAWKMKSPLKSVGGSVPITFRKRA